MNIRKFILAWMLIAGATTAAAADWAPLAGEWRFALDPKDEGVANRWYETTLADRIQLPGTTDGNRKGTANEARETGRLTRLYPYAGAAWYQRDIEIPKTWAGKRVTLMLERTKTSRLWLDSSALGGQNSLVAPHVYTLGTLAPGRHRLTLRIDNTDHPPIGDPHQISDQTQTNWNGVIGKLGLQATDPLWIEDVQVYPDQSANKVRLVVELGNASGNPISSTLSISEPNSTARPATLYFGAGGEHYTAETIYSWAQDVAKWDEFTPALRKLTVELAGGSFRDQREVSFGMRDFTAKGTQFQINGKTVFLRGNVDNCEFPLTGHPPMTVDGWLRVFQIAKSYGINHYRFHSWCPPEAAFEAADQTGIYLQPELPNWKEFGEPEHDEFLRAEGERILRFFGNHPSFVMLSLGNELGGKQEVMAPFVKHFRELDARHLYAQGSNNWFPNVDPGDDYWVSFQVRGQKIRGSYATVDPPLGHVQTGPPSTLKDYRSEIAGISVPVVSHEIGEYQIAPDFREIPKYTGVLSARNLEAFRKRLEERGMSPQANDFLRASGALAVACYREDIETALRTHGFGGFQLLDLADFPGQGTALVGILNAFMEPKGLIAPDKWREFCSETVPLLRMAKYTWTTGETFTARAEVAHYGAAALPKAVPAWTLRDTQRRVRLSGKLPAVQLPRGALSIVGEIRIPLSGIAAPAKLTLELALQGTAIRNSYDIWVYPAAAETAAGNVLVSRTLDDATRRALASGGSVLLIPEPAKLPQSIGGSFAPDFWNYGMFRKLAEERHMPVAPGTLGILCNPSHLALAEFPTEFHSNWQWFHLLQNSRALILDGMPAGYRPIVQVIDNFERAHKLGVIFEVRVGRGKLLVSSIDLPALQDKPEGRQLLHSLLAYMKSAQFAPTAAVDEAVLDRVLQ